MVGGGTGDGLAQAYDYRLELTTSSGAIRRLCRRCARVGILVVARSAVAGLLKSVPSGGVSAKKRCTLSTAPEFTQKWSTRLKNEHRKSMAAFFDMSRRLAEMGLERGVAS